VGQLCVWDVITGTCMFSLEAHMDASVTSLIATPLYLISSGTDNRICIYDKYSGIERQLKKKKDKYLF
jgi:WD40 repeat protein